jgi:hypothetical protein
MKAALTLFFLTGLSLVGFCGWGLFTVSGQEAFPEMAGVLLYCGALGGAIVLLTGLIYVSRRWRDRSHRR